MRVDVGVRYWLMAVGAVIALLAMSYCARAEEYMVVDYGVVVLHHHHHHLSREGRVRQHAKAVELAAVPLPRPNPLDRAIPGSLYEAEAALINMVMFGSLCPLIKKDCHVVRSADTR